MRVRRAGEARIDESGLYRFAAQLIEQVDEQCADPLAVVHPFVLPCSRHHTYAPGLQPVYAVLRHLGVIGLTVPLYLIGTGLSMSTIRAVGARPLLQGLLLWFVVAAGSLALIRHGWIHL